MTKLLVCYGYVCPQPPVSDYYCNPEKDCHASLTVLHFSIISQGWQDLTSTHTITIFITALGMDTTEVYKVHYWINRTERGKSHTEQHTYNDNFITFTYSSIHVYESVMIVNNGYLNYSSLVLDVPDGFFFRFPDHNFVCILHLSHMCYMRHPYHLSWF